MTAVTGAVGESPARIEARDKLAGSARYVDDLSRPGMLHAAIAQSPYAHARILSCDTSKAAALPGVLAVVTGADIPGRRVGGMIKDETMLAVGKVRYLGEPVAAVAARDLETARLAAQLVEIEYEPLPHVLDPEAALAPGAPILHEAFDSYVKTMDGAGGGNLVWQAALGEGDPASAWARCDVIVEGVFHTPAQYHGYMEPNGVLAEPEAGGRVLVVASCQSVHHVQQRVADELGLPMSAVRAQVPRVGGGFGGKHASNIHSITALLALRTGRPVKLQMTRALDMEIQRCRHPARIRLKTGATKDGVILAREAEILLDGGAYADESPNVMTFAMLMVRGPYSIPHVRIEAKVAYTNKLRAGSFRGFGNPQATFAGESQIDELAAALGMDPVELRLKNAVKQGDRWIGGHTLTTCRLSDCLVAVRDAQRAAPPPPPARPGVRRGVGFASLTHISGLMGTAASVQLRADGTVALNTGCVDIGQGSDTVMTQMCASVLRLPVSQIAYAQQDSDLSPYNWKTAGSRSTYMTGRAVAAAAEEAKKKILDHASEMLECAKEDLELRPGGRVGIVGVPGREVTFRDIAMRSLFRSGGPILGFHGLVYDGERFDPKRSLMQRLAFDNLGIYTFGAQCVEAEVDEVTGKVTVLRVFSAHDVGRAINPVSCEGQIQGGFVQGMGYALTEEMVWDDDGRLANPSFADYKMPGIKDSPAMITPILIEEPEPTHPFGAKGVGEISMVGAAPAIANAVADATGARLRRIPMTPERVLDALEP
ncbi:MAG: xanthine dehydrogenase family protein molybdopterin-binding subunit [Acetobacteraceae bacterium]